MKSKYSIYILCLAVIVVCSLSCNSKKEIINNETVEDSLSKVELNKKLEWFHEAKYGMFIHWGLYSIPAGEWKGKPGTDHGEWIQCSATIPGVEYEKLAAQFNPVKFDAKQWVSLAKKAGMKYIVVTTKHHDGFCLFDSKLTKYDIVDATPYGKDPMKELAAECEKQGIKLCFYYSVQDWHHPEYPAKFSKFSKSTPDGFHGAPNPNADYLKYFDYMEGQVKELLTNYGPVGIIWFDWWGAAFNPKEVKNIARAHAFVDSIHKWQPNCLINNRLNGIGADYGTPEQEIPGQIQKTAFEVCMTLNDHWGFNKNDQKWKSASDIVYKLCDIAGKGGNYLLNVGPTAEGVIPEKSTEILSVVGRWLEVNGEAIYNSTSGGPSVSWNEDIKMITAKPQTWYLHVFDWPKDRKIYLDYVTKKIDKAYLLADKQASPLKVDVHSRGIIINLPDQPLDSINNVIVLKYQDID